VFRETAFGVAGIGRIQIGKNCRVDRIRRRVNVSSDKNAVLRFLKMALWTEMLLQHKTIFRFSSN
jgi:hypothetical protein